MKKNLVNLTSILMLALSANMILSADSMDGLRDPTRPLDYIAAPLQGVQSELVLTSVMISGEGRAAVINGERVMENQMVGGAKVISIQPGRVILRNGDQELDLRVHQYRVRQSPPTTKSRL